MSKGRSSAAAVSSSFSGRAGTKQATARHAKAVAGQGTDSSTRSRSPHAATTRWTTRSTVAKAPAAKSASCRCDEPSRDIEELVNEEDFETELPPLESAGV